MPTRKWTEKLQGREGGARKLGKTADGRYIVVDGRRWRATNPNLPEVAHVPDVHQVEAAVGEHQPRPLGAQTVAHAAQLA